MSGLGAQFGRDRRRLPWVLSNVLFGSPVVHPVFVDLARYTAEQRNYYWQHERGTKGDPSIIFAQGATVYPAKTDKIADKAKADSGNFGRLARYGIMSLRHYGRIR